MKQYKRLLLVLLAVTLSSLTVFADDRTIEPDFGLSSLGIISSWNIELYGGLRGIEIIPGVESRILLHAGGGYFQDAWYEDNWQVPAQTIDYNFPGAAFQYWQVNGKLGMQVGWAYSGELEKNWLYSLIYLKTKRQWNIPNNEQPSAIMTAAVPERDGLWESSVFFNLVLDLAERDKFLRTKQGAAGEVSVEWAPGIGINTIIGEADYYRLNGTLRLYQTLFKSNTVSAYIGNRFIADYLGGDRIPLWAQGMVAGLYEAPATGGMVRGINGKRYPANVKLINNLEMHLMFPTLISYAIVPDFFVFFDGALIDNRNYALMTLDQGLYTAGGGIYLDFGFGLPGLFDYAMFDVGYFISYSITEKRWNFFNLVFSLHF